MNTPAKNRVATQYLGHDKEDSGLPWMDYALSKTRDKIKSVNQNKPYNYVKVTQPPNIGIPNGDGDLGESLLDGIKDPLSLSREQGYQPANENDTYRSDGDSFRYPIEFNKFDRETTPETDLKLWWDERHRQDQSTGNVWGSGLYGESVNFSNREASIKLSSKTIHQIISDSNHKKTEDFKNKGKALTPKRVSDQEQEKKGLFEFLVSGGGGDHSVKIQFLKTGAETRNLLDHPCQVACDCESFLYWGPQYYAVKGNYMFMPLFRPQILPPRSEGEGGRGKGLTYCKHLYAVFTHLTEMGVDSEYSEDVKNNLLDIRDDQGATDRDELLDKFHVDRKTKFKQFIEDDNLHRGVYNEAVKILKDNGLDEHQVADYVTGDFSKQNRRTQEIILEQFSDHLDILVLLLLEYRKTQGSVPVNLVDTAYEIIKDTIS